jgi:hypothetical protein
MSGSLTAADVAGAIQIGANILLGGLADDPQDGTFELTSPATGQRFRVTVTEVPAWSEQMDQELQEVIGAEATS